MEHLAQGEDIQMRPNSVHLLTFSEKRKDAVEVLDQGMTSYQSTEDMYETISLLHYSAFTGTIEDDMWIIDSGACYPRYLGITRKSCLEARMVLDMEYREQG
jgi:hypothetical protein